MRYHDFHLAGYRVSDFGATISLDLVYSYSGQPTVLSVIEFSDVAAYHFVHTGPAIMNHIGEESIETFLKRHGKSLAESWRLYGGVNLWNDDLAKYRANLEKEGYHAWTIDCAIGFQGFVVAKAMLGREPNPSLHSTPP